MHFRLLRKNYQHVLAFIFTVDQINKDPYLLPNITLGFRLYDSLLQGRSNYDIALSLLSTKQVNFPNIVCGRQYKMSAIVGGLSTEASIQMATIFDLYKIPQVGIDVCKLHTQKGYCSLIHHTSPQTVYRRLYFVMLSHF